MAIAWTKEYDGAAEPDSGGNYDWVLAGTDFATSDGNILTINTIGQGTGYCNYQRTPDVNFDDGITMEVRAKLGTVVNGDTNRLTLNIYDGTQDEYFYCIITPDNIDTNGGNYGLDTSKWHTYRLTVKGTTLKVYVDGVLRITDTIINFACTDLVTFGDTSGAAGLNLNVEIDYLNYKIGEAIIPVQGASFLLNLI